ncbi:MAG: nitrite/sulfite reductase, partial [Solirubrobacterales bacterium]
RWVPLKKGHITTRPNIQVHHVPLADAAEYIRELGEAGLSSREGCGNTVRNVTGDPWAGILEGEVFDPTPYVGAYVRYFVRHPTTQLMPRKVKTAFTGSDTDRALTGIHDIAFIARERDGVRGFEIRVGGGTSIMPRVAPTLADFVTADPWAGICHDELWDPTPYVGAYVRYFVRHPTTQLMPRKVKTAFEGTPSEDRSITGIHDIAFISKLGEDGTRGFEVRVGGGTSIMPRIAPTLYDFVEADNGDYLKVAEAVFRIFDRQDWLRVNRARARIKVLIDKIGMDAFRELVDEELQGDWVNEREFGPELVERLSFAVDEEANAPEAPLAPSSPNGDRTEFERFLAGNVEPQRQEGFSSVEVKITRGDLTPEQFRGLAQIMREYTGGSARSTVQQNFVLRWVRDEALYDVWERLEALGLGEAGAREITDTVSCPGTDSCKLGITSSMGLNRAIKERVTAMQITDELTKQIHIKMSGCPNGCSQHHIANIGFYGASLKVGGRAMPAYIPHIGGNFEGGPVAFGKRLKSRLPAKRVPEAVERWIRLYETERNEGEEFNPFAERVGAEPFEAAVKDLTLPSEFSLETMQEFIDWNRSSPYEVVRGEGECAI